MHFTCTNRCKNGYKLSKKKDCLKITAFLQGAIGSKSFKGFRNFLNLLNLLNLLNFVPVVYPTKKPPDEQAAYFYKIL
jgi:hypothetical protein